MFGCFFYLCHLFYCLFCAKNIQPYAKSLIHLKKYAVWITLGLIFLTAAKHTYRCASSCAAGMTFKNWRGLSFKTTLFHLFLQISRLKAHPDEQSRLVSTKDIIVIKWINGFVNPQNVLTNLYKHVLNGTTENHFKNTENRTTQPGTTRHNPATVNGIAYWGEIHRRARVNLYSIRFATSRKLHFKDTPNV